MKRIFFFATKTDIALSLHHLESIINVKYVEQGIFHDPNLPIFLSYRDIPDLGVASSESGIVSRSFIVSKEDLINSIDRFVDVSGRSAWSVSNGANDFSVDFTPAGRWRDCLLAGTMRTVHETDDAQEVMRAFIKSLKASFFKKVEIWWVGSEAMDMLRDGKRLCTAAEQSSSEFDLKLPLNT